MEKGVMALFMASMLMGVLLASSFVIGQAALTDFDDGDADLNDDGSVDDMDRKVMEALWGGAVISEFLAGLSSPDVNGDGTVDAADNALVLGAFGICETVEEGCNEDLNNDFVIDEKDIKMIEGYWGMSSYVTKQPDLNGDGVVDATDLALLLRAYDEPEEEEDDDEDENGEVDDGTERNAKAFASNHGSRMRLLQLLRGAWVRMLWAEAVVSHLEETGDVPDDVIDGAKGIVEEMRLTLDEIRDLIDNPTTKGEMAEKFFHLIREIRDLVREFRILVGPYLTEGDRGTLRSEFNEINRDQLQDLHREILDARRALNAERAEQMGVNDGNLVNKIRNGDIPENEIAQKVREHVAGLSDEEKAAFRQRLREGTNDRSDSVANWVSRYQDGWLTKATDRLQSRADSLQESGGDDGAQLFSDRASRITEKRDMLRDKFSTAISNG